jgi:hypothetical protein
LVTIMEDKPTGLDKPVKRGVGSRDFLGGSVTDSIFLTNPLKGGGQID